MSPPCPGCGIPDLLGPFENDEGAYWECHHCDRHVYGDELLPDLVFDCDRCPEGACTCFGKAEA